MHTARDPAKFGRRRERLLSALAAAAFLLACGDSTGGVHGADPTAAGEPPAGGSDPGVGMGGDPASETAGSSGMTSSGAGGSSGGERAAAGSSGAPAPNAGAGAGGGQGTPQPSTGCGSDWAAPDVEVEERRNRPPVQVARREIMVDGTSREYLISVPVDYDSSRPYPLILGFHGTGGDREQLRGYLTVEVSAQGQAIAIYPTGLPGGDNNRTRWSSDAESNDLLLVDALIEKYERELCIDSQRIFATGHSAGGCFSNTVGCYRGDVLRGIAPVAGCGPFTRRGTECTGQIATLQIHSPKDTQTSYSGAIRACTRYLRASSCDEMPECGCHWVDEVEDPEDMCEQVAQQPYPTAVEITTSDRDEQPPILRAYQGCDASFPVVFADHWRRERDPSDPPDEGRQERWHNPPPWAEDLIWEFFSNLPPLPAP